MTDGNVFQHSTVHNIHESPKPCKAFVKYYIYCKDLIVSKFKSQPLATRLRLTNQTADKHEHIFPPYINASPLPMPLSLRQPPPLSLRPPKAIQSKALLSSTRHATFVLAMIVDTVTQLSIDV
jgi:hypothetical protein